MSATRPKCVLFLIEFLTSEMVPKCSDIPCITKYCKLATSSIKALAHTWGKQATKCDQTFVTKLIARRYSEHPWATPFAVEVGVGEHHSLKDKCLENPL